MTVTPVTLFRLVCDRCREHNGQVYDSPYEALHDANLDGWTRSDQDGVIVCALCHEESRREQCYDATGHEWETPANKHLATIWAGGQDGPEFIMRHCGEHCGETQMMQRGGAWHGVWLGFDRYGWLGDTAESRNTRRALREQSMMIPKSDDDRKETSDGEQ